MNYQHLRYFREVAHSKSYQQAADKLFITQPTLSRAIASLEIELNVDLFEKVGRSAKLTPLGIAFLARVEESLDTLDRGIAEIQDMKNHIIGTLSIASVYGYSYRYLPEIIQSFAAIYPNVHFELTQMPTRMVIDQVNSGSVDLGIHLESDYMQECKNLEYYALQEIEIVVVVSERHPLAGRKSCRLTEIASGSMVSFDRTSGLLYKTIDMFQEAGLSFTSNLRVGGDQSLLNLVRSSMGAACVLRNVAESTNGIVTLEIEDAVNKWIPTYITLRKRNIQSHIVQTFLSYILKNVPC